MPTFRTFRFLTITKYCMNANHPSLPVRWQAPAERLQRRVFGRKYLSWALPSYRSAGSGRVYQVSAHQPRIVFPHQAWSPRPIASGVASFSAMQARLAFAGSARTAVIDVAHPPAKAMSAASASHRFNRIQSLAAFIGG